MAKRSSQSATRSCRRFTKITFKSLGRYDVSHLLYCATWLYSESGTNCPAVSYPHQHLSDSLHSRYTCIRLGPHNSTELPLVCGKLAASSPQLNSPMGKKSCKVPCKTAQKIYKLPASCNNALILQQIVGGAVSQSNHSLKMALHLRLQRLTNHRDPPKKLPSTERWRVELHMQLLEPRPAVNAKGRTWASFPHVWLCIC